MIEITNLFKRLGNKEVLKGVNLNVEKGETLTIMGQSGCGKSVLLKHIIGLFQPDKGSIKIEGKEIVGMNNIEMSEIRKKFGVLFQNSALFDSMTVWENVGFMLKEHKKLPPDKIKEIVKEKLALVGMKDIEEKSPSELSGGMQKRVALARAISMEPEIVLYDEPTTGLDPIMSEIINELIISLSKKLKITSIVVTHDIRSASEISDRIAFLFNGVITQIDSHDKILNTTDPILRQFLDGSTTGPIET
ncbi:MAG: ABC transporter ATP-binding protein [bacterium]|nr:ABC transporter ATP-binding protein [bacterium]